MHLVCPTCQTDRHAEFYSAASSPTGFRVYCRRCEEGCVDAIDIEAKKSTHGPLPMKYHSAGWPHTDPNIKCDC